MSDEGVEGASGHTTSRMSGRIEVVARVSGRRHWTVEQKLVILRDAFGPNGSVRDTVERHEVGSGQLYTWRQQAIAGTPARVTRPAVPAFGQVQIAHEPAVLCYARYIVGWRVSRTTHASFVLDALEQAFHDR